MSESNYIGFWDLLVLYQVHSGQLEDAENYI